MVLAEPLSPRSSTPPSAGLDRRRAAAPAWRRPGRPRPRRGTDGRLIATPPSPRPRAGRSRRVCGRASRRVPHPALVGLEQPLGDRRAAPTGSTRSKNFRTSGSATYASVTRSYIQSSTTCGGGVVAEQVVDRGRHLEGALVAVAVHGVDPLRVDDPGAHDPRRLLGQRADLRARRVGGVAEPRLRVAGPVSARTVATIPPWSWR